MTTLGATPATTELTEPAAINADGVVRRGKAIIATEESRTNTAYGLMTTPDRVSNITLPTDGLLIINYMALMKESVAGAARACIVVSGTQLTVTHMASTASQEAIVGAVGTQTNVYRPVFTSPVGLEPMSGRAFSVQPVGGHPGFSAVGQTLGGVIGGGSSGEDSHYVGGECRVWRPAATFDVSIMFKASSGSVTVKDRKLWVKAEGYA